MPAGVPLRSKLFDKLSKVYAIRKVTGSGRVASTVNANAAAGATALTLASAADAGDKDILLVGAGEEAEAVVQNGAPAGAVCTIFTGLKKAHVIGEPVAEGVAYDLGEVAQTALMDAAERGDILSDVSRSPHGSRLGFLSYGLRSRLQSLDAHHLALALGLPFSAITGAGTQADPTQFFTDGDDLGREPTWLVAAAIDEEGTTRYIELDACDADYSGIAIPLSQGPDTGIDARLIARMHPRWAEGAVNFVPDVTRRITKAHYPEALTDSGFFEVDGAGASTTTTAAVAPEDTVLPLASATGVAGGDWFVIEGGGRTQIVWAESLATLNLTLRTRIKYPFPSGSTVKELKIVRPGGSREGSTQLTVGGSVRPVRFDQSRVQAGVRPGTARFGLGFAPTPFTLETLRRRLALPSGAIAGSVLTVSDLAGTDAPIGAFAKVQRKDAKTVWAIINHTENTLAQLELALSQSEMWAVPLEHIGKQIQYLQY